MDGGFVVPASQRGDFCEVMSIYGAIDGHLMNGVGSRGGDFSRCGRHGGTNLSVGARLLRTARIFCVDEHLWQNQAGVRGL